MVDESSVVGLPPEESQEESSVVGLPPEDSSWVKQAVVIKVFYEVKPSLPLSYYLALL